MLKISTLLSLFRPNRRAPASGLSRRDALIASIGGAIPLLPTSAAGQSPLQIRPTRIDSRAELASLPVSFSPVVWDNSVFAFTRGDFDHAAALYPDDYVAAEHLAAPIGAWLRQGQVLIGRADAPPRSIEAKSLDIYSVNDKGAVGDGKTDNTDAINAAILEVHLGGGGEIIFGASTSPYHVKGPVIVPSNVVINLNGQTLSGEGLYGGAMFTTGMVRNRRLVPNKGASDESDYVFYSSVRNGMIRNCGIAFDFQNFNVSCSVEDIATFQALQFGVFHRCFYMSLRNCSARGATDASKPAFAFTGDNNLISLLRVSATTESGFLFEGGTTSVSMISCSCEGAGGSAVTFRNDCLGVIIDSGYWEAVPGTVFDFTQAEACSVSFRGNYFNYCDIIINDGGKLSNSTLMGVFDDTNYITNVGGIYDGIKYRGLMILTCPRNFMRFDLLFSNNAPAELPTNWIVGPSTRIQKETAFTGRSLADVRGRSLLRYGSPVPVAREGDVGDPYPGTVDRSQIVIAKGSAVSATLDTGIVWRPNSLRATFLLAVSDDTGIYKVFGDIYGDQLVQQDGRHGRVVVENQDGRVRLRVSGIQNRSGAASITGSLQLCT
ncbi:glycosyl hydrolase family 28-related protein [Sphingopyxis sp.]|uniref:glycosyl hydrolase family 28-related protein n=1 Tax=Sphingopyxis sp. TaxID=1908224 RepID=UPI00258FE6ED|nr:glycosyl hydrolase family 28-related protein [Sphingopyxis sp.]